jgi:hypothetical protein
LTAALLNSRSGSSRNQIRNSSRACEYARRV